MLLSFQVSNHKSIRGEQTLHLQPVYDKTRPALPVAAIFGANAAGKSNVLDALHFMVDAVRNSFVSWRAGVPHTPFRFDRTSENAGSTFVVDLLLDGVRYTYGIAVDAHSVLEEWLHTYPQHRRRVIFERRGQVVTPGPVAGLARGQVKALADVMPRTALFLSVAGDGLLDQLAPVHRWFRSGIDIIPIATAVVDEQALIERLENAKDRNRLVGLLVAADVGVVDVEVEHLLPAELYAKTGLDLGQLVEGGVDAETARQLLARFDQTLERLKQGSTEKRLTFVHDRDRVRMSFADESHGTKVWLSYIGPLLDALDSGGALVVDELDTSLHPHLMAQLIGLFHNPDTNPHNGQLVFTTHDTSLLGRYFNDRILARDEIWFTAKNNAHETELFSLAEFKAREDDSVQRRYLTGTYGAVPLPNEHVFGDALRDRSA